MVLDKQDLKDEQEIARTLLWLGWGRARAKQELDRLNPHKMDIDEYNRLHAYFKDFLQRVQCEIEFVEECLERMENKESADTFLK